MPSLKGQAVELWRDGRRFFLVADEEDGQETIRGFGARRGEIWTPGEIEFVARLEDQDIRDEIAGLKRQLDGRLSPGTNIEGISPEQWKARMLNRLFSGAKKNRATRKGELKPAGGYEKGCAKGSAIVENE